MNNGIRVSHFGLIFSFVCVVGWAANIKLFQPWYQQLFLIIAAAISAVFIIAGTRPDTVETKQTQLTHICSYCKNRYLSYNILLCKNPECFKMMYLTNLLYGKRLCRCCRTKLTPHVEKC